MYRLFGRVGVQLQPPPIHNNAAGEGLGTASFSSWQATAGGGRAWADADFADINVVVKAKLPNGALCHQGGGAGGLASPATAVPAHAAVLSVASLELSSQICSRRASRAQQEKKQPLGQQEQESDQVLGEEVGGRAERLQLALSGPIDPASLQLLLDHAYTGRCDLPVGGGLVGPGAAAAGGRAALARLARGLGLGPAACLLRGRLPLLGQGLPPLGPRLGRLLPRALWQLLLLPLADGVIACWHPPTSPGDSRHDGDASSFLGGECRSGAQSPETPENRLTAAEAATESWEVVAHVPLEAMLHRLAEWQLHEASSVPSTVAAGCFSPDAGPPSIIGPGRNEDREDVGSSFSDVFLAVPLLMGTRTVAACLGDTAKGGRCSSNGSGIRAFPSAGVCGGPASLPAGDGATGSPPLAVLLVPAHRVVLAAQCEYFRALLQWRQQPTGSCAGRDDPATTTAGAADGPIGGGGGDGERRLPVILVPEADVEVLLLLLGFLYTGRMQLGLLDLLKPADGGLPSGGAKLEGLPSGGLRPGGKLPSSGRGCHRSCLAARACLRAVLCADALLLPEFRRACRYSMDKLWRGSLWAGWSRNACEIEKILRVWNGMSWGTGRE